MKKEWGKGGGISTICIKTKDDKRDEGLIDYVKKGIHVMKMFLRSP